MSSNNSQSHPRILVLDDDKVFYAIILKLLNHIHPGSVEWAETIPDARDKLKTDQYSLLIADLVIESQTTKKQAAKNPQQNELDDLSTLIHAIQQRNQLKSSRIPIIVVTGHLLEPATYVEAFNRFPGWIWGWHEKLVLEQEDFRKNVAAALEGSIQRTTELTKADELLKTYQLLADSFASTILASVSITIIILLPVIGFALNWLVQTMGWDTIEPLAFILTLLIGIIGIVLVAFSRSENKDTKPRWFKWLYQMLYNHKMKQWQKKP